MPQRRVQLVARGPLLIGAGPAVGNVQVSRDYVPGSVWRGALAGAILDGLGFTRPPGLPPGEQDYPPEFAQLFFGPEAVRFSFLYPAAHDAPDGDTLPLPLTARECRLYKAFAPERHGIFDGALSRIAEAATGAAPLSQRLAQCPRCGERLELLRGVATATGAQQRTYASGHVGRHSFTRVGLNRATETAQDQVLYVLDTLVPPSIDAPLAFVGAWTGSDAQLRLLDTLIQACLLPDAEGYQLHIGTARARGMGQVQLRLDDRPQQGNLAERVAAFQPQANGAPIDAEHIYAALTLRAPLLLLDERGLPAETPSLEILRAYLDGVPAGLELLHGYSVVERETWQGWSAAWGMARPATTALAAGGVLLLRAPRSQHSELLTLLAALETDGLGERRAEGWGEIRVCDPFHVDHDERRVRQEAAG
jgi:CRISPR-associated protein Csx10